MTSLPVPDSPWISTVESVGATVSTRRSTSSHDLLVPTGRGDAAALLPANRLLERLVLDAQLAMLGGAAENRHQLVVAERLLDVVERALVHRLHRRLQRRLRRHEDHRHVGIALRAPRRESRRRVTFGMRMSVSTMSGLISPMRSRPRLAAVREHAA